MYPTEWQIYDGKARGIYGQEEKCWEHAVFDSAGNQVGKIVKGRIGYTGRNTDDFNQYGLVRKQRQFKEYVYKPPRSQTQQKEVKSVTIRTYDIDGTLLDLTVESRMVYWNSKGPYIKTRSNGSPRMSDPENFIVEYRVKEVPVRVWRNNQWEIVLAKKTVLITPEEFSA